MVCCRVCRAEGPIMKRCSKCHAVFYCSRTCQAQDWPRHRSECTGKSSEPATEARNNTSSETSEHDKNYKPIDFAGAFARLRNESSNSDHSSQAATKLADTADCAQSTHSSVSSIGSKSQSGLPSSNPDLPAIDVTQPVFKVIIKSNKEKHVVASQENWTGTQVMAAIAHAVQIPAVKMKLIHKGKLVNETNINELAKDKALFQAIGEKMEDESDLNKKDIDIIMMQSCVERNVAIRALRETGSVIDAILHIGNKT